MQADFTGADTVLLRLCVTLGITIAMHWAAGPQEKYSLQKKPKYDGGVDWAHYI